MATVRVGSVAVGGSYTVARATGNRPGAPEFPFEKAHRHRSFRCVWWSDIVPISFLSRARDVDASGRMITDRAGSVNRTKAPLRHTRPSGVAGSRGPTHGVRERDGRLRAAGLRAIPRASAREALAHGHRILARLTAILASVLWSESPASLARLSRLPCRAIQSS
jgi:hypothetical protein